MTCKWKGQKYNSNSLRPYTHLVFFLCYHCLSYLLLDNKPLQKSSPQTAALLFLLVDGSSIRIRLGWAVLFHRMLTALTESLMGWLLMGWAERSSKASSPYLELRASLVSSFSPRFLSWLSILAWTSLQHGSYLLPVRAEVSRPLTLMADWPSLTSAVFSGLRQVTRSARFKVREQGVQWGKD